MKDISSKILTWGFFAVLIGHLLINALDAALIRSQNKLLKEQVEKQREFNALILNQCEQRQMLLDLYSKDSETEEGE